MKLRYLALSFLLSLAAVNASASSLQDLYAEQDSKLRSLNTTYFNIYSDDALIITSKGKIYRPSALRKAMGMMIKKGIKNEIAHSEILHSYEIRSGIMKNLMGMVVISKEFSKVSVPNDKDSSKRKFNESTTITTRVLILVIQKIG